MAVELAHITDVHLPTPAVQPRELLCKRVLGWLSWRLRRRRAHRREALAAVVDDIRRSSTEAGNRPFLLITGDLVNISTRSEFAAAAEWLRAMAEPDEAMFVPGNHDYYVAAAATAGLSALVPWMTGARETTDGGTLPVFPVVRRLGDVALVGLNSAFAAPWREASGRIGAAQLERLETVLRDEGAAGRCRVVLVHHPPLVALGAAKPRKALRDAAALEKVLLHAGAELVLFGHTHRWAHVERQRADGRLMHVLSAASASMSAGQHAPAAGWQHITVQRAEDGWRLKVRRRELGSDGAMRERERLVLHTAGVAKTASAA